LGKKIPDVNHDPVIFQEFRDALGARDPKTVAAYLATMRDFVAWLTEQPGGASFHLGLLTETAVRGYLDWGACASYSEQGAFWAPPLLRYRIHL
jgi:hypothetical protein